MDDRLVFVLGAKDNEMVIVENILYGLELPYAYAVSGGNRCHSGNAYKTVEVQVRHRSRSPWPAKPKVVTIECGGDRLSPYLIIDHHRPGDFGFNLGPDRYWEGSSLGQLCILLEYEGFSKEQIWCAARANMKIAAANDHCPFHAMKGLCADVSPEGLLDFRMHNVLKMTGFSERDVKVGIERSVARLRAMPRKDLFGTEVICHTEHVPFFLDAALRVNKPIEYVTESEDNRVKRGLNGVTDPELVKLWMDANKDVLVDLYGSPARGYAGGYLP